jgi:ABC-type glutathione transport system ATPase component
MHGTTVVVVSHDLAWLSELCEHILRFMPDGSLAPLAPHKEECP